MSTTAHTARMATGGQVTILPVTPLVCLSCNEQHDCYLVEVDVEAGPARLPVCGRCLVAALAVRFTAQAVAAGEDFDTIAAAGGPE